MLYSFLFFFQVSSLSWPYIGEDLLELFKRCYLLQTVWFCCLLSEWECYSLVEFGLCWCVFCCYCLQWNLFSALWFIFCCSFVFISLSVYVKNDIKIIGQENPPQRRLLIPLLYKQNANNYRPISHIFKNNRQRKG